MKKGLDKLVKLSFVINSPLHEMKVSTNDGEQVVEVVGHATAQASDHLHFLRLVELFLSLLQLRNVAGDAADADYLIAIVLERELRA